MGALTLVVVMTVRTSSRLMPSDASLLGSTWTRTAGFCWPPISTWAMPGNCEICCARMFSAASSTWVIGSSLECTASTMIGGSAGLTLR